MAFPKNEQELRTLLDSMQKQGAPKNQMKAVVNEYFKIQSGGGTQMGARVENLPEAPLSQTEAARQKLKEQPLLGGAIKEKGLIKGGLENIKTGIEATGLPELIGGGIKSMAGGEKKIMTGIANPEDQDIGQRTTQIVGGTADIIGGGLQTVFAPVMAIAQKTPIVNTLLTKVSEGFEGISGYLADTIGQTDEEKEALKTSFNNLFMLTTMKAGESPAIQAAGKAVISTGADVLKGGLKKTGEIGEKIKTKLVGEPITVDEMVGKITQAKKPKDIQEAGEALSEMPIEDIKIFKDLTTKTKTRIKELATKQDELMDYYVDKYKPSDVEKITTVERTGEKLTSTPVNDAIAHLEEFYATNPAKLAEIKNLKAKFETEGLSMKELNEIARTYNVEFGSKGFSKTGEAKTSVTSVRFEDTRSAIKDIVREKYNDPVLEELDTQMSNLYTLKRLSEKMEESVNGQVNKIQKRTIMEKVGRILTIPVRLFVGTTNLQRFITRILSKENKTLRPLDLQEMLEGNLKTLKETLKKNDVEAANAIAKMAKENMGESGIKEFVAELESLEKPLVEGAESEVFQEER